MSRGIGIFVEVVELWAVDLSTAAEDTVLLPARQSRRTFSVCCGKADRQKLIAGGTIDAPSLVGAYPILEAQGADVLSIVMTGIAGWVKSPMRRCIVWPQAGGSLGLCN